MADLLRFLLIPAIVVAGWMLSSRHGRLARRAGQLSALLVAIFLLLAAATGWLRLAEPAETVHRWTGHGLTIAAWLFVPFSIGMVLQQQIRRQPVRAVAQILLLLLLVAVTLLASFTGYLRPPENEPFAEETNNRFIVLHQLALPCLIGALVGEWFWWFRRARDQERERLP